MAEPSVAKSGYKVKGYYANSAYNTLWDFSTTTGYTATVKDGSSLTLTGYTFKEWNTQADGSGTSYSSGDTITAFASITLYAIYEIDTYIVTYMNGTSEYLSQTVEYNETATKPTDPTSTSETLVFCGWYTDEKYENQYDFDTQVTENISLYAKWNNGFTVTFDYDYKTDTQGVVEGETATAPTTPTRDGYTFGGWYSDSDFTTAFEFDTKITEDITVYAKWTAITYILSFDTDDTSITVTYDSEFYSLLPTPIKDYNTFGGWYIGGVLIEEDTVWNYTEDQTATAEFLEYARVVTKQTELQTALDDTYITDIIVGASFTITSDVTFNREVTLYSNGNYTIDNDSTNYRFYITAEVNFGYTGAENTLTITLGGQYTGVILNSGSTFNIDNVLKVLPGAQINIAEGATVYIKDSNMENDGNEFDVGIGGLYLYTVENYTGKFPNNTSNYNLSYQYGKYSQTTATETTIQVDGTIIIDGGGLYVSGDPYNPDNDDSYLLTDYLEGDGNGVEVFLEGYTDEDGTWHDPTISFGENGTIVYEDIYNWIYNADNGYKFLSAAGVEMTEDYEDYALYESYTGGYPEYLTRVRLEFLNYENDEDSFITVTGTNGRESEVEYITYSDFGFPLYSITYYSMVDGTTDDYYTDPSFWHAEDEVNEAPINGQEIFVGWNAQADGNGEWYEVSTEVLMIEHLDLYAIWESPDFYVPNTDINLDTIPWVCVVLTPITIVAFKLSVKKTKKRYRRYRI